MGDMINNNNSIVLLIITFIILLSNIQYINGQSPTSIVQGSPSDENSYSLAILETMRGNITNVIGADNIDMWKPLGYSTMVIVDHILFFFKVKIQSNDVGYVHIRISNPLVSEYIWAPKSFNTMEGYEMGHTRWDSLSYFLPDPLLMSDKLQTGRRKQVETSVFETISEPFSSTLHVPLVPNKVTRKQVHEMEEEERDFYESNPNLIDDTNGLIYEMVEPIYVSQLEQQEREERERFNKLPGFMKEIMKPSINVNNYREPHFDNGDEINS